MAGSPGRGKEPRDGCVTAWVSLLGFNVQETAPFEDYIQLRRFRDLRGTSPWRSTHCVGAAEKRRPPFSRIKLQPLESEPELSTKLSVAFSNDQSAVTNVKAANIQGRKRAPLPAATVTVRMQGEPAPALRAPPASCGTQLQRETKPPLPLKWGHSS